MKRWLAAAAAAALSAAAPAQAEKELKFSIFSPPRSITVQRVAEPWAKWIEERVGNEVRIKIYAGGTLGRNPAQQLKLVEDGIADISWVLPSYTPGRFPTLTLLELPGMVDSAAEGTRLAWELYDRGRVKGFESVKVLALYTTDLYGLHLSTPIKSIEDLKGRKIRSGGQVQNEIIAALGMVPVGMPVTQIVEAMSRNVIDGAIANWTSMVPFKLDEVASFHYEIPLGVLPMAIIMNRGVYESLPPAARKAMDESPAVLNKLSADAFDKTRDAFMTKYGKDPKHTIARPDDAEGRALRRRLDAVVSKVAGSEKLGDEYREAQAILMSMRSK